MVNWFNVEGCYLPSVGVKTESLLDCSELTLKPEHSPSGLLSHWFEMKGLNVSLLVSAAATGISFSNMSHIASADLYFALGP